MEPIKVLVICQRKKSYVYEVPKGGRLQDSFAVDITVKKIENYVYNYYGTRKVLIEYLIEYRNNEDQYDADYKMTFNPTSKYTDVRLKSYEFIRDHINYYDMVMLQTCPLILFIDIIKYLSWILKPSGVLTIKAFCANDDIIINTEIKAPPAYHEIIKYFYNISIDVFGINTKED